MRTQQWQIGPAVAADWPLFLAWARAEGWRVPQREVELFRDAGLGTALVLREEGSASGFVTCCAYQRSGWIGNLLVPAALRRGGRGRRLFGAALAALSGAGCRHLWLTASPEGEPLYAHYGFAAIGTVRRWVRPPGGGGAAGRPLPADSDPLRCDRLAWGESRAELLQGLARGGGWSSVNDSALLLQKGGDLQILGPWHRGRFGLLDGRGMLEQVLPLAEPATELVCDVVNAAPEELLLATAGFERRGETVLMVRGGVGPAQLERMVALATLGSCG